VTGNIHFIDWPGATNASASAVNCDGSVIALSRWSGNIATAALWSATGGLVELAPAVGQTYATVSGLDASGFLAVGQSGVYSTTTNQYPGTAVTFIAPNYLANPFLSGVAPPQDVNFAVGVSADGKVIVGSSTALGEFVWTAAGAQSILPQAARSRALSADGQTVALTTAAWTSTVALYGSLVWTPSLGLQPIPKFPEVPSGQIQPRTFLPTSLTSHGQVMVGTATTWFGNEEVEFFDGDYVWTARRGMRSLVDVLQPYGLDPPGVDVGSVEIYISNDGRVIAGFLFGLPYRITVPSTAFD